MSRAVRYFKDAEIGEADYVLSRAFTILRERKEAESQTPPNLVTKARRPRKQRTPTPITDAPATEQAAS